MEARAALAFVARRQGVQAMPSSQWAHIMSLELAWMSPGEAKAYIAACADAGLLQGDPPALTFDAKSVTIPKGFRPDPSRHPSAPDKVRGVRAWIRLICEQTGQDQESTMGALHALQDEMGGFLHAEAAVLVLAKRAGLDVRGAAQDALADLTA